MEENKIVDVEYAIHELAYDDDTLRQFLHIMVNDLPNELEMMKYALQNKDFQQLQYLAHKLTGRSVYCAAMRLKQATSELDNALQSGNQDSAPTLLAVIEKEAKSLIELVLG